MSATNRELVELQETLYNSKNPTRSWLHISRRDWIMDALRASASGRDIHRAIEVGPGSGVYLPLLSELAREVVAADIEQAYLEHAEALAETLPNLDCRTVDITRSDLPTGEFDLVLCTEVIEHIADSPAALRGLRSLVAKGGRLVLSTPQRYSPLELFAKIAFLPGIIDIVRWIYREPIIPTGHINLLTEKTLKTQLDDAGLVILDEYKCGMYLPVVAEALGHTGLRFEQWLEKTIRGTWLDALLWTQCYVLAAREEGGAQ